MDGPGGAMSELVLRPYRLGKDADALTDLAEAAYVEDYARMGRDARAEVERERRLEAIVRLARIFVPRLRDVNRGLLYEWKGAIVSAVMFSGPGLAGSHWTIDTVATHPDHQRRGLARRLLEAVQDEIVRRGGSLCTLKVREDNAPAYALYRSSGFSHFDTTLHMKREEPVAAVEASLAGYRVRELSLADWYASWRDRFDLARREVPADVQSLVPVEAARFRKSRFVRMLAPLALRISAIDLHHWAVERDGRLVATLAVRGDATGNRNHEIDVVIDPEHQPALASGLLDLGLAPLASLPHANVLVETRSVNEPVLAALRERAFNVMSTWHCLGRRFGDPARKAQKEEI